MFSDSNKLTHFFKLSNNASEFVTHCIDHFKENEAAFSDFLYQIIFSRISQYLVDEKGASYVTEDERIEKYFLDGKLDYNMRALQVAIDLQVSTSGGPLWKAFIFLLSIVLFLLASFLLFGYLVPYNWSTDPWMIYYKPDLDHIIHLYFGAFFFLFLSVTIGVFKKNQFGGIKSLKDLTLNIKETNKIFFEIQDYERTKQELLKLYDKMVSSTL